MPFPFIAVGISSVVASALGALAKTGYDRHQAKVRQEFYNQGYQAAFAPPQAVTTPGDVNLLPPPVQAIPPAPVVGIDFTTLMGGDVDLDAEIARIDAIDWSKRSTDDESSAIAARKFLVYLKNANDASREAEKKARSKEVADMAGKKLDFLMEGLAKAQNAQAPAPKTAATGS